MSSSSLILFSLKDWALRNFSLPTLDRGLYFAAKFCVMVEEPESEDNVENVGEVPIGDEKGEFVSLGNGEIGVGAADVVWAEIVGV